MCMVVAKCIHGFYSIMHDRCYTYMHALHYSYVRMQCINTSEVPLNAEAPGFCHDVFIPLLDLCAGVVHEGKL